MTDNNGEQFLITFEVQTSEALAALIKLDEQYPKPLTEAQGAQYIEAVDALAASGIGLARVSPIEENGK